MKMGKHMRVIKIKEKDAFLIRYGALLITGSAYRLNRDNTNTVHSRVSFEGITLLFPSRENYIAKTKSVLLCFTHDELKIGAHKAAKVSVQAKVTSSESSSQIHLDSQQSHILEDMVIDNEVSIEHNLKLCH